VTATVIIWWALASVTACAFLIAYLWPEWGRRDR
jgi:hypothetical protein